MSKKQKILRKYADILSMEGSVTFECDDLIVREFEHSEGGYEFELLEYQWELLLDKSSWTEIDGGKFTSEDTLEVIYSILNIEEKANA